MDLKRFAGVRVLGFVLNYFWGDLGQMEDAVEGEMLYRCRWNSGEFFRNFFQASWSGFLGKVICTAVRSLKSFWGI